MNKKILLSTLAIFLLTGCNPANENSNDSSTGTTTTSEDVSTSTSEESSTTSVETSTSQQEIIDLGKKSIAEIKSLCNTYVTNLNSVNIGINKTYKVTVIAKAIDKFDLVKTKSSFGLNESFPAKTILGDETGYIAAASANTNNGNSLFGKVGDYAGKDTSKYSVTGYLSIYLGQPELYVPDTSYTWNENLDVNFDAFTSSKENISALDLNNKAKAISYNCAGHGYGDVYTLNNVKCVSKDTNDTSTYLFSDGSHYFKVVSNNIKFDADSTYDIAGMVTTRSWAPAIRVLSSRSSSGEVNIDNSSKTVKQITDLNKIKRPQEDTNDRQDAYIETFADVYKADVYVDYYSVNGKYYVTFADTYYSGETELTRESAYAKGVADIENSNCWNISESEMSTYCPFAENIGDNNTVSIIYFPWQSSYNNSRHIWKVLYL